MTTLRPLRSSPLIVWSVGLLVSLLSASLAQAQEFDLRKALEVVEESNLSVLLSRETILQAQESALNARANLLPTVTFDASQRRSRSASFGSAVVNSGVNSRFDMGLNGRVDLLDAQNIASHEAAKLGVDVAKLDAESTRETIRAVVANVYLQHRRNLARVDLTDANIARADALLDLAVRQRDAGVATQIDVTRAQAQLAIAQQARLQQETDLRSSELRFKRLLGLSLDQEVTLAPFASRGSQSEPAISAAEATALRQRSDYQRSDRLLDQSELEVRAAKFNRLPTLALNGNYGRAAAEAFDGNDADVWSAGLSLSVPVFDGLRTGSLTRLALSRRRANELRHADLENAIGAEVRLAVQNARSRRAQIDVASTSLSLAQDELRLAQIRFEQGAADNREIIEAQNRLAVASDNLLEATYQYNVSRVELARATGDVRAILGEQSP